MHLAGLAVDLNKEVLNEVFNKLKVLFQVENVSAERREYLESLIKKYGYLPYSQQKALEELSDAEVVFGVQKKLELASTYVDGQINYDVLSPVERAGFKNADWFKTEQHSVKLLNLAALGNGNVDKTPAKFIDWMRQLLILPSGKVEAGVMATTMYLTPFHPREFGCAYLPAHSGVSPALECSVLKEQFGLTVEDQVKVFLAISQLAGHPVIYDILPQTARFSKIVLTNPYCARWFDIPQLIDQLKLEVQNLTDDEILINIIKKDLKGRHSKDRKEFKKQKEELEKEFLVIKKELSEKMLLKDYQKVLQERADKIIHEKAGYPLDKKLTEDDIHNQGEIIGELISQGLWPSPGGAWCSAGVPVFDKMSNGADYPTFKHFDFEGNDVTELANLDCQTPYYFTFLEDGTLNEPVIEFFIENMRKLQSDYNFDGFRVDHIDHIVNKFSQDKDGKPISYRAPRVVLARLNAAMKKEKPYFAALAEYMLWDFYLKEYHQDMGFDVLWGQDIVCQHDKTVAQIFADNKQLDEHNKGLTNKLSILKTYNNQDGEFEAINRYPGQLGVDGALFKWLKQKTIVGGPFSQRPMMYVDGDESFTKTGVEGIIGNEVSMMRANNQKFYEKFDAINRFALNCEIIREGKAKLIDNKERFASWIIENDSDEAIFIAANEMPPKQKIIADDELITEKGIPVKMAIATIPKGYKVISGFNFNGLDVEEFPYEVDELYFPELKPSEFYVYKLIKN